MDEINIKFEPDLNRFIARIEGHDCLAEYAESRNGKSWNIIHTWVAEELRGQGIAEKLMIAVAEKARATGRTLKASCSYAALFLERHREYDDIMEN